MNIENFARHLIASHQEVCKGSRNENQTPANLSLTCLCIAIHEAARLTSNQNKHSSQQSNAAKIKAIGIQSQLVYMGLKWISTNTKRASDTQYAKNSVTLGPIQFRKKKKIER